MGNNMLALILSVLYFWLCLKVSRDNRGNTFIWFCLSVTFTPIATLIAGIFIDSIIESNV